MSFQLPSALQLTPSWAHADWLLGTCVLSCQAGSQGEQKKEAPSAPLLCVTSEVAESKMITNTLTELLLIISFSYLPAPATNLFIPLVSLTALCTWSVSLAHSWCRFSLGFTRGKKQWHQKERGEKENRRESLNILKKPSEHQNRSRKALSSF